MESTPFAKALLNGQAPGSHHGMPGDVTVVAYEASTGALAVGTSRGALKVIGGGGVELLLHDAAQPMQGMQLDAVPVPVQHLAFLRDGAYLCACFRNCALQLWSLADRRLVGSIDQSWTMTAINVAHAHPGTGSSSATL